MRHHRLPASVLFLALVPALLVLLSLPLMAEENVIKKGEPSFLLTFTERIRQESSDNVTSLDDSAADSSAYVRFRTSLGALWKPFPLLELVTRLTNENRYYLSPKSDLRAGENYEPHEVFFDTLFLRLKNLGGTPITLTLGRQDLMLGEGFVIFDGGPLDGSRSAYFNAARLDYAFDDENSILLFYISQPETDTLLPVYHDVSQRMVEQPEQGFGAYFTGTMNETKLEGYLFRKNVRETDTAPSSGYNVAGARAIYPWTDKLTLTTEAAYQFGKYGEADRTAFGGYFRLDYRTCIGLPCPTLVSSGIIYLGGDNPATADVYEGWDPSFSRWPKWSESLIYLQARETKPADWTNFVSFYGVLNFLLSERAQINLTWHHLLAPQTAPVSAALAGSGKNRGDLFITKLTYDVNKHLAGHFIWEHFVPGDFYFDGARSFAWVRFELMFRY